MQQITFAKLIEKIATMPVEIELATIEGLTKSAVQVHKTAVEKFGKYQPAFGPFQAWAVLAPSTVQQKLKAGSSGDDPLIGHYVKGTRKRSIKKYTSREVYVTSLRQSLAMDVDKTTLTAQVGTNDPVGEYQEYGTSRGIPPRPFLRPALYQTEAFIKESMKEAIGLGLVTWLSVGGG